MDAVEFIKGSRRMYKVTGKHAPTLAEEHRDASGGCAKPNRSCGDCRKEFWGQKVK